MYLYRVMWNLPGCLPEMDPIYFTNEYDAREFMKEEFRERASMCDSGEYELTGREFDKFADDMEFHGDAAMGNGDSFWDGPDGYSYSIVCEDVEESEARELLNSNG